MQEENNNSEPINTGLNPYNFEFFLNASNDEYIDKIKSDFYNSIANPKIPYQFIEPQPSPYVKTYINADGTSIEYLSLLDEVPNFPTQEQIERALDPRLISNPQMINVNPTSLNLKANMVGTFLPTDITK